MKYYAGIGSRETPEDVLDDMERLASILDHHGYLLRSGGAQGADQAFGRGAGEGAEIFLPWTGFENQQGTVPSDPALESIAAAHHPAWERLRQGARKLHARNTAQVLGEHPGTSPVSLFVVCWTRGYKFVGGTATALRIATTYKIPIYNLARPGTLQKVYDHLASGVI